MAALTRPTPAHTPHPPTDLHPAARPWKHQAATTKGRTMDGYWATTRAAIKSWPTTLRLALLLTIPSTPPLLILLLK